MANPKAISSNSDNLFSHEVGSSTNAMSSKVLLTIPVTTDERQ